MAQSARGLFRATGKAAKTDLPRESMDFYPTPPEPIWALIGAEPDMPQRVWEPACGDGAMVRQMVASGRTVAASDIVDRGHPGTVVKDFFAFDYHARLASAVVTNPPFSAVNWRDGKGRWITHAMETLDLDYMALLLSWGWPGAGGLAPLWAAWPPQRVYLMRWKIDFTGQGAPPMLNAWFVWDRAERFAKNTELLMLDRPKPPRWSPQAMAKAMLE